MKPFVQTIGLTKSFKDMIALDGIDITINKGDVYGLIGKNGAGKTTLMKTLLGMITPTSGNFLFEGKENYSEFRRKTGAIIEKPALYMTCTAYENMKRYAILFGGNKNDIDDILNIVGLYDYKNKKAGEFSLGMKQRLGIAIALLGNPEFLILDEPVNGLDPTGIIEIRNLIVKLNQTRNTTILLSSHLLDELAKVATRYAIIDQGKLIEEVSSEELQERCKKRMVIHVDDVNKACSVLKEFVSDEDISVSENIVTVFSHVEESAIINKKLCESNVNVSQIIINAESLEQYFMRKVGQ